MLSFPSSVFFLTDLLLKKMIGCTVEIIDITMMALSSGRKSFAKQESPF